MTLGIMNNVILTILILNVIHIKSYNNNQSYSK